MKIALWICSLTALIFSCKQKRAVARIDHKKLQEVVSQKSQSALPTMDFDKTTYDFGTIQQGEKVSTTFAFTNSGKAPLLIRDAHASCGCTVPDYPKQPIAPGGRGRIEVTFNSFGKKGRQNKTVTLLTNTEAGKEYVRIKANVMGKKS